MTLTLTQPSDSLDSADFPYATLGQRIAAARNRLRWPQREAAAHAGMSSGTWSNYETGITRPSPEHLHTIASLLDLDYNELAVLARYADAPILAGAVDHKTREFYGLPDEAKDLGLAVGRAARHSVKATVKTVLGLTTAVPERGGRIADEGAQQDGAEPGADDTAAQQPA